MPKPETLEHLIDGMMRCKRRASLWTIPEFLGTLEAFALRHQENPEMLCIALDCRIALKSLLEKDKKNADR